MIKALGFHMNRLNYLIWVEELPMLRPYAFRAGALVALNATRARLPPPPGAARDKMRAVNVRPGIQRQAGNVNRAIRRVGLVNQVGPHLAEHVVQELHQLMRVRQVRLKDS